MELVQRHDMGEGLTGLTLNRTPVNAISAEFLDAFAATLADLERDPQTRAVVLTSPFKVYSAGLDLKEAQAFDARGEAEIVRALNEDLLAYYAFPKPVVAAVTGAAIAGGLFFVLGADWRVSTARAQFGLAEVRVGADFPAGPMEIARDALAPDTLRRLMLTGQPIRADAALAQGFIDEIAEDVLGAATAKARELAALPPLAYGAIKRQIRRHAIARIREAMAQPYTGWFTDETRPAMQRMMGAS
ncbi:MAG: enoyl-CoA hydratase/isomerase family protein [Pseudooceanicola sp.]|nr:enoyl-CoA hydratase/isomerase family protein [Pseudooceanicola sp.]